MPLRDVPTLVGRRRIRPSGLTLEREIYIDHKPAAYTLAGDHARVTEAQILAEFEGSSS